MTTTDLRALVPFLVLTATSLGLVLAISFRRSHGLASAAALLGFALAALGLFLVLPLAPYRVGELLILDRFALFYLGLVLAAGAAVGLLSRGYLEARDENREEFYLLLLLASLGAAVLVAASHFASFFLGLELLSVSLYVLIAYFRIETHALEAGLKYLVLAGASSAFLLFGMALVYAASGSLEFSALGAPLAGADGNAWRGMGLALILTGIGFKLAVAPFHMWAPDVYQGAPAPVAAFLATVSKGAIFALLLRLLPAAEVRDDGALLLALSLVAVASMFLGNLLALRQDNVKRILAYSSIAHLGYLLVAFVAGGTLAEEAVSFYLAAYFVTTLGAFGVVTLLSGGERDAEALELYRGLFWRRPALAMVFTAMLLSLAGIPLTAGFLGKFYVMAAGVESSLWILVLVLVANSAIGLFYYLRIVLMMIQEPRERMGAATAGIPAVGGKLVLAVLTLLLLWLGVYPATLLRLIELTVGAGRG